MLVTPRVQRVYRMSLSHARNGEKHEKKKWNTERWNSGETLCCRLLDFKLDP